MSLPNLATLSKYNHKNQPHNHKLFYMDDNIELMHKCDKNHSCNFTSFLSAKENYKMVKIGDFLTYQAGCTVYIRECGSTLYVELARTAPPTNTNFRLTFLLTRLQEALYEDLAV